MIKIICPLCENTKLSEDDLDAIENGEMEEPVIEFEDAEEYAKHIIELHDSDIRNIWATHYLSNLETLRELAKQQQEESEKKAVHEAAEKIRADNDAKNKPELILGSSTNQKPQEPSLEEMTKAIYQQMFLKKETEPLETPQIVPSIKEVKPIDKDRMKKIIGIVAVIILVGLTAIIFIMRK